MRVVLDTNIWISSLLVPESIAGDVIAGWRKAQFSVLVSDPILQEIERVLQYPKINKRIKWNNSQIKHYLDLLSFFAEVVIIDEITVEVKSDPMDTSILATLISGKGDFLVTGDRDLLILENDYPIVSLNAFHQKLG